MAVDCHFHVIGGQDRFPLHPSRRYTPAEASLEDWQATVGPLGISHGVVVQPSVYGIDNRALLAALAQARGRCVGVGAASADIGDDGLDALVGAGIRGLRFAHFEPGDPRQMPGFVTLDQMAELAPRMRERGLHADLFTDSRLLAGIAPVLRRAGIPVVIDHLGRTPAALGTAHGGVPQLQALLDEGWCWVKLSGLANVSGQAPHYADARAMHDWLVAHFPERLVWGSDWPHTKPQGEVPSTKALLALFTTWTPSTSTRRQILLRNPQALYRLPDEPCDGGAGPLPGDSPDPGP